MRLLVLLLAICFALPAAAAQDWPSRTVRIVVGFGPGSTPDVMARLLAERLGPRLGQAFVVENKVGAGGVLAAETVAKAEPDGLTIGVTIPGPLVVAPMTQSIGYDPKTEIAPVMQLATQPSVLVVPAGLGANSFADLLALLKKTPGKYNYASIGIGSVSHLSMELLASLSGTEIVHVPYKSSPEALTAVVAGEAQMAALAPLAVVPQAEAGKVRMLAVTTGQRSPLLPNVPTFAESGLPAMQAEAWMALIAPGRTPAAIVQKLNAEVKAVLGTPEVREQMLKLSFQPVLNTPAEFAAVLAAEEKRWRPVVEKAGLLKK
jgi:tripartite-type tricarboxylate transporter receptor subunit TctC